MSSSSSSDNEGKPVPGHIVDYNGDHTPSPSPQPLERKLSIEKEEDDKKRKKKIKCGVLVVFAVLFVIALVVLIVLGVLGILSGGSDDTSTTDSCPDCLFQQSDWKIKNGDYIAAKENCGTILVNLAANYLSIKRSEESDDGGQVKEAVTEFSKALPGLDQSSITLSWEVDKTMRDNETIKLVFSDTGDEYAGCGDFDGPFFKTKPSGDLKKQYMLWTSRDNPTYLPFYLSRNDQDRSICMFADAQGAPIEITVTETTTEWLIYMDGEVKFYSYNEDSLQDALNECIKKWKEIYPVSDAPWTDDFIIGSLTPEQVKADQDRGTSIASHYILSTDIVSMTGSGLEITDEDSIADYSNVLLPLAARQKINEDSGITATKEKGYYLSNGSYILDFDTSDVQSIVRSNYLDHDKAGIVISGFLKFPKGDECPKYLYCSGLHSEIDSSACLSDVFGESRVFEKHNMYDVSVREALQPSQNLVIETIASPGTTHFHRTDLELTEAGLKACYNNILNLQRLGIGAVTCNICAGVVPSTDDQKSLCFRWGQLALLMPYVIISSEDEAGDLTDALSDTGNDGFTKMKESIALRKQLHYYLTNSRLFIQEKSNGVVIGDNLFMVVNLEGSSEVDVEFPAGEWLAPDSALLSEGIYLLNPDDNSPQTLTYEEDITKLMFYKLDNIFVLKDKDNEDDIEVHIFQLKEDYFADDITSTFTYNKHKTVIKLDPQSKEVNFTYTAADTTIDTDKFKVSKLVIYYWIEDAGSQDAGSKLPKVRTYSVGSGKYNVVFNYLGGNDVELNSIFSNWTESLLLENDEG